MRKSIRKKSASSSRIIRRSSGFTLIELLVAILILAIIVAIAFSIYRVYIDKAKITVAESVLIDARKNLEVYLVDNKKYPTSIDFASCIDENSRSVFDTTFCDQLKNDLSSIDGYSANAATSYSLTARAKDTKNTLMTLTPQNITIQGQ